MKLSDHYIPKIFDVWDFFSFPRRLRQVAFGFIIVIPLQPHITVHRRIEDIPIFVNMKWDTLILVLLLLASCQSIPSQKAENTFGESQPNILWITCEDISPTLAMYSDSTAHTPNLDALAAESVVYENAFATVGVCAPARSSIITGMYPTSIGTMHMRTGKDVMGWGKREYKKETGISDLGGNEVRQYAAVIPEEVKCFTEYLRADGYYCTNSPKTDYQFAAPQSSWDENGNKAHWRNTPDGQPFFSMLNINVTHESRLWKHADKPLTVSPDEVTVPPYLPDNASIRKTVARHYSNVELLDREVGKIIQELKQQGLYDQTIIFFFSDHGGPLPRQKREAYDSGLKVPMLIKHLNSKVKVRDDQLVSFVDLAPTVLTLAGIDTPDYLDGQSFINARDERTYVYGSGDRFDEYTDRVRIVRTDSFLYVKNYYPELTGYKDLSYRKNVPGMNEFLTQEAEMTLDQVQRQWFQRKEQEELYAVYADPHNIKNIAKRPAYASILKKHRALLDQHLIKYGDLGDRHESLMINEMWPNGKQPMTAEPTITKRNGTYRASCGTPGASISYLVTDDPSQKGNRDAGWKLYTEAVPVDDMAVYFKAERIGFRESAIVKGK